MKFELLDHGYLELIETWGSDERIIESARMSTQKGFIAWGPRVKGYDSSDVPVELTYWQQEKIREGNKEVQRACGVARVELGQPGDEKLLRYLYENKHSTPFEMAGLTIEVQAPIFVFREWHRHRVPFSYSEASARYEPLPDLNYVPTVERLMMNGGANKQAGTVGTAQLTEQGAINFRATLEDSYGEADCQYRCALQDGVPKELARILLPVDRYSKMRASANLRGWLAFMTLRSSPKAQYEIRVYSDAVGKLIEKHFRRTWELFAEDKKGTP